MRWLILPFLFLFTGTAAAQEREKTTAVNEEQLESLAESTGSVAEDDAAIQQRDYYHRHLLNLNTADADELNGLQLLLPEQVDNFLTYRRLLGKLLSIYELQAIPGWDLRTIQLIRPYCTVRVEEQVLEKLRQRWKGGETVLLMRYAEQLEKSKGYTISPSTGNQYYTGGRAAMFFRYKYNFKQLLQWGITGKKDAGEPFLKGKQRWGFDFYSFHLFAVKLGIIKALALGDYTVNLGQGLIQWQSLAFGKSADVLMVKRASPVLRPYSSGGEYNFQRGFGITVGKQQWELTLFASLRHVSSTQNMDSVRQQSFVSAIRTDGLHRTQNENLYRNNLYQFATGSRFAYLFRQGRVGINFIQHHFSVPIQTPTQPYDLFSLQGNKLSNASIDYSCTFSNIHLFGEAAIDDQFNGAILNGALIPVAPSADISILYRKISPAYRSINASAFTVNTNPVNESGLYMGISMRPVAGLRLDGSADIFHFPWLKYQVDAPSYGSSFLLQLSYSPNKSLELSTRYKMETKDANNTDVHLVMKETNPVQTRGFRFQVNWEASRKWGFRGRMDLSQYNSNGPGKEAGFLIYSEGFYRARNKKWLANLRLQYAETGGFNSRIYSYENDLLYSAAVPFSSGREFRYFLNLQLKTRYKPVHIKYNKIHVEWWLKWSQSIFPGRKSIGTGLDEINGNHKTEIRLQAELIL